MSECSFDFRLPTEDSVGFEVSRDASSTLKIFWRRRKITPPRVCVYLPTTGFVILKLFILQGGRMTDVMLGGYLAKANLKSNDRHSR